MTLEEALKSLKVTKKGHYYKKEVDALLSQLINPLVKISVRYHVNDDEVGYEYATGSIIRTHAEATKIAAEYITLKRDVRQFPYCTMGDRYLSHPAYNADWAEIFKYNPGELQSISIDRI